MSRPPMHGPGSVSAPRPRRAGTAWVLPATFQIVLLEGAEVVFIVLALGAGGGSLASATAGALALGAARGAPRGVPAPPHRRPARERHQAGRGHHPLPLSAPSGPARGWPAPGQAGTGCWRRCSASGRWWRAPALPWRANRCRPGAGHEPAAASVRGRRMARRGHCRIR